ncbi:MAG: hypothetical protein QOK45_1240 [Mycobacterium sp.]|nr:hypothetical protein [Mycobacterium sp.]
MDAAYTFADWTEFARDALQKSEVARMEGFVTDIWLAAAQSEVEQLVTANGNGDYELFNPGQWDCHTITSFLDDSRLEDFFESLTTPPTNGTSVGGYQRRGLRILHAAGSVHSRPFRWHYDGSAMTMIVPIVVPNDGSGQLAIFPDSRPHRRSAVISTGEKLLAENWLYQWWSKRRFEKDAAAHTVALRPGNAYVFRGYRSLHAVFPWRPGEQRVTLVLHYGYPYGAEGPDLRAGRRCRKPWRRASETPRPAGHLPRQVSWPE